MILDTANVRKAAVQRGGSSLATYSTTVEHLKKHDGKEHEELSARGQKDERSRQESLLDPFQKQVKLPADNVKTKGITEKLLNFTILENDEVEENA